MLSEEVRGTRNAAACPVDGHLPSRLLAPREAGEVARLLREARDAGAAVIPWGGGTHQSLGGLPARYDIALDLRGLDAIRDHAPEDLTVTVEAGVTLARLNALLAAHGQCLPLDVEEPSQATVGGLVAAGVSGPRRLAHGTVRDRLLWTEVATPAGTLLNGGARVVKSVAGYDTPKLHIGALGSLGVVTAACFRLQPLPAARRLVRVAVPTAQQVGQVIAATGIGGLRPALLTVVRGDPTWGGLYRPDGYTVACGFEGPAAACEVASERLEALVSGVGGTVAHQPDSALEHGLAALMAPRTWGALRVRLITSPDRVAILLAGLAALPLPPDALWAEAGNGIVRAAWGAVPDDPDGMWLAVQRLVAGGAGTWVVERAPISWKRAGLDVWGPPRPDQVLMRRLKQAWDPQGVLAPGRTPGG